MEGEKLKPCPFCGGEAELRRSSIPYSTGYRAVCEPCCVDITLLGNDLAEGQTKAAVIRRWNRRSTPTGEDVKALVEMAYRLRDSVTKSGGIDLRDPELLHQAADALCDAAGLIAHLPSLSDVRVGDGSARELAQTVTDARVSRDARHADEIARLREGLERLANYERGHSISKFDLLAEIDVMRSIARVALTKAGSPS